MVNSEINFKKRKHIHFSGIKGVGMTALCLCAQDLGIKVSGSDIEEYFVTDDILKSEGIEYSIGFDPRNIQEDVDLLVTTGAHGGYDNSEYRYAKHKGLMAVSYAEALADLANTKRVITTVGVGGKSTISSMLATIFELGRENPSYVVGVGDINPIGRSGRFREKGDYFIVEGDDYVISPGFDNRAKFLLFNPYIVVVSNIEHDHPDIYENIDDTFEAFNKLFAKIPKDGLLVACIDNKNVKNALIKYKGQIETYGFSNDADYQLSDFSIKNGETIFRLRNKNLNVSIFLKVPGKYNALNAAAAFIVAKKVKLSQGKIIRGLYKYRGCKRRFEYIGRYKDIEVYDDYAHHPQEIKALLDTAKEWFSEKRVVVVFQPHTYSRTKVLFKEFVESLSKSDLLAVMDIYSSAREKKDKKISSKILVESVKNKNRNAFYTGDHVNTLKWIKSTLKKGDVLLTVGAGDIFHLHKNLIE